MLENWLGGQINKFIEDPHSENYIFDDKKWPEFGPKIVLFIASTPHLGVKPNMEALQEHSEPAIHLLSKRNIQTKCYGINAWLLIILI